MLSPSSLFSKIIGVLARNGGGKWNQYHSRVGSMSLLNMAFVCIRVGLGTSHLIFCLPPWVWVILFDHSSTICLIIMISKILMSNTAKSSVVSPICSREVGLCSFQPLFDSPLILIHKHYVPLSRINDVGNTMAHLRSRLLPVDFNSLIRILEIALCSSQDGAQDPGFCLLESKLRFFGLS